jgi:hypothetical protein
MLQGAPWSPSKLGPPPTPQGIVRARTKEYEARSQVRFILGWHEPINVVPTHADHRCVRPSNHPGSQLLCISICMQEK